MSLENSPNSSAEFGEFSKLRFKRFFFLSLENSPNSRIEFGEFSKLKGWVWRKSPNSGSKSPNSFFSKKKSKLKKYTHSEVEFGEFAEFGQFSKLRFKRFFFLSLENSPNSRVEFGEFSKLKGWVWRKSPNSSSKSPNSFFSAKQWIEKTPKLRGWVWRILQTQIQKNFFSDFGELSKLKGWVWRILQIPVQNLQTHSFLKKIQTQRLSLENSPNSMVENSPNSGFFQKHPQP